MFTRIEQLVANLLRRVVLFPDLVHQSEVCFKPFDVIFSASRDGFGVARPCRRYPPRRRVPWRGSGALPLLFPVQGPA